MLTLALLYSLPAATAMLGILLLLADARTTRREKPVPVPVRNSVRRKRF